jgi:hypothetical protein
MPIVSLSAGFVRRVVCVPARKKVDYFDVSQRGFLLEVRQSGGKTYYQRYTDERGRERQYKIGRYRRQTWMPGPSPGMTIERRQGARPCPERTV